MKEISKYAHVKKVCSVVPWPLFHCIWSSLRGSDCTPVSGPGLHCTPVSGAGPHCTPVSGAGPNCTSVSRAAAGHRDGSMAVVHVLRAPH